MKILGIALLWATLAPAYAQADASGPGVPERIAAERERLQALRAEIEQTHDERLRACWQRFAVNVCLREVRRSRHDALDPVRVQELSLNAQEREWRTQQREERLRDKQVQMDRQP